MVCLETTKWLFQKCQMLLFTFFEIKIIKCLLPLTLDLRNILLILSIKYITDSLLILSIKYIIDFEYY